MVPSNQKFAMNRSLSIACSLLYTFATSNGVRHLDVVEYSMFTSENSGSISTCFIDQDEKTAYTKPGECLIHIKRTFVASFLIFRKNFSEIAKKSQIHLYNCLMLLKVPDNLRD